MVFDDPSHQNGASGYARVKFRPNGNGHHPEAEENGHDTLNDKVAVIIGELTSDVQRLAHALAFHGAEIALIYQPDDHLPARHTARRIRALGKECLLIPIPVEGDAPRNAMQRAIDHFGQLDIFIDQSVTWHREQVEKTSFPASRLMATAMRSLVSS